MRRRLWLGLGVGGAVAAALVVVLVTLDSAAPAGERRAGQAHQGSPRAVAPGKPTSVPDRFRASPGDTFVTLRWSPVADATAYAAYYRDVTKGEPLKLLEQERRTTITLAGLVNGHIYEFQVSATNAAGEGPRTPAVKVRVMPPMPTRPRQLRALAMMNQVWLTWIEPRGPNVRFWVEVRDVRAGTSFKRLPDASGTNRYLVTDLLSGHTYQFRIVAENAAGTRTSATVSAKPS